MKKGGGKRKGSSFERYVAKDLSLWITGGGSDGIFWRTHSSGSLGTVGKRRLEYGDIMAIDDLGKPLTDNYNIECRHGKCLNLRHLIYPVKSSSIIQLIYEGRTNAEATKRKPLWIIKEQGKDILVMMRLIDCDYMRVVFLAEFPKFNIGILDYNDWKKEFKL